MFNLIRNLLAIVGLVTVITAVYAMVTLRPALSAFIQFEDNVGNVFAAIGVKRIESGNMAEAGVEGACG